MERNASNLKCLKLFFISSLFIIISCNKNNDDKYAHNLTNQLKTLKDLYNCENTLYGLQVKSPRRVITNREDYDRYVTGTCHPDIDFSKYNLVIGKLYSEKKVSSIDYEFYRYPPNSNSYFLSCKLKLNPEETKKLPLSESLVTYSFLVPKSEKIRELSVNSRTSNG